MRLQNWLKVLISAVVKWMCQAFYEVWPRQAYINEWQNTFSNNYKATFLVLFSRVIHPNRAPALSQLEIHVAIFRKWIAGGIWIQIWICYSSQPSLRYSLFCRYGLYSLFCMSIQVIFCGTLNLNSWPHFYTTRKGKTNISWWRYPCF